MNQTDTQKALDESRHLRCTIEETQRLIVAFEGARQHIALAVDSMAYQLDVLRERVEMQSIALGLIERLLNQAKAI